MALALLSLLEETLHLMHCHRATILETIAAYKTLATNHIYAAVWKLAISGLIICRRADPSACPSRRSPSRPGGDRHRSRLCGGPGHRPLGGAPRQQVRQLATLATQMCAGKHPDKP